MQDGSKLNKLLGAIVTVAERKPGRTQMLPLTNGLTISVRVEGETTHLALSRMQVFPSLTEWTTILNHWPCQIKFVAPQQVQKGPRKHLYAVISRLP